MIGQNVVHIFELSLSITSCKLYERKQCFQIFKYILFPTIPTINQKININKLRFQGHLNLRFFTKGIGIWQPEYRINVNYFWKKNLCKQGIVTKCEIWPVFSKRSSKSMLRPILRTRIVCFKVHHMHTVYS